MLWFPVGYEVFIRESEEMDKITIAIAEDQEYTRKTLARIVESQEDFSLVGTAQNGEEALHLLRQHNPQILLLDMLMPLVDGKEAPLTDWQGKTISVKLPYTPAANEQAGNLYAVYVNDKGKVQWLTKSSYDADQKAVIFEAQHFSIYGVGYKNPVPNFTDINGHWAKEHILFAVSRGLFSGTSKTTFSPNTTLTRGMFVTALGRLAGIDPADYQNRKFTDVKANAYYSPYVNWAASKGIVSGTTSSTFAPDSSITREQMAVIMKNYADKMGYSIPKTLEAVTFADNAQISSWAKDAVKAMQQAGVLSGKANNLFDPKGNATRAQVAVMLHRFLTFE